MSVLISDPSGALKTASQKHPRGSLIWGDYNFLIRGKALLFFSHRVDLHANARYSLCPSYPAVLAVPRDAAPEVLRGAASFRTKRRFPVLTWRSLRTGFVLCRSAEPGVWPVARWIRFD